MVGFGNFLQTRDFSDLKLTSPDGRVYYAHKLILSNASEYFEHKLDEMDPSTTEILLEGQFAKDFDLVLK